MSRWLDDPSEAGSVINAGWTGFLNYVADTQRSVTINGTAYKGTYRIESGAAAQNTAAYSLLKGAGEGAKEYHIKTGFRMEETGALWNTALFDGAGTEIITLQVSGTGGFLSVFDSTGLILTTTFTPLVISTWFLVEAHVIHDGTNGVVEVWVDNASVGTYSGAVSVGDGNGIKQLRLFGNDQGVWDDIGINDITLRYDGGSGSAPAVGEVITGAGGGVATVTALLSGDATAGTVRVHLWNGTAFVNNEALTGGIALVALVDTPNAGFTNGFEPNSGRLGNTVVLRFLPTGDGNSSGLTNSAGTSVNNWSYVDDTGGSDYVEALAVNQRDTYALSVAAGLPSVADCEIPSVSVHCAAQGSLNGIGSVSLVVRYSGTDYDGDTKHLPSSYNGFEQVYDTRPDGDAIWDAASAAAIEVGTVFVA